MSTRSFKIHYMLSVDKGDFWNERCRIYSEQRSLTSTLDIFADIFQSMPMLACYMSKQTHVCVWGVPPLLLVISIQTERLPYIGLKLIVWLLGFYVLLVTIWPLGSIIVSIQWVPGPLYLPSKLRPSLLLMCLWIPCILGPLASVMCTWLVLQLTLIVVSIFCSSIVSLM